MPKIQFDNLPPAIAQHLRTRIRQRKITEAQLQELIRWRLTEPEAPDGDWYKDFGSFILVGTGQHPKSVLIDGMKPFGTEL